jgi:flavin-dependent dehydrogenase
MPTSDRLKSCDVLIIGAGMAGACLARQLSLELPELDVMIIDQKTEFDHWVGESSIEVFDDYANRTLKLGPYLATHHIVKHGLRFWFDSKEKDLPMCELSEQGRTRYTTLNRGVQIDRARFDRDLCQINREHGVEVMLGTRVLSRRDGDQPHIVIDGEGQHRVATSNGTITCRYLVDAAGRNSPLVKQLDLALEEDSPRPDTGAYWIRASGCNCIDELGDDAWQRRVDYTLRWSSTNHFMYDGYWIWLIPLDDRVVSLGVTYDRNRAPLRIKNGEEFVKFLRSHKALDELLGDRAEVLDFLGLKHIVRGAKQFFSKDRWYLTGMSGLFVDPLFSVASGYLSINNRLIVSLIQADLAGNKAQLENRLHHFNIIMGNTFRRAADSFSTYHHFGSFDAFVNWQTLRYHTILNYEVPMQHADHAPMIATIDAHKPDCGCAVGNWSMSQQLGEVGDRLTKEFVEFAEQRDAYYDRNRGYFHDKTERESTRDRTIDPNFQDGQAEESRIDFEAFFRYFIQRMCDIDGVPFNDEVFRIRFSHDWCSGQTLDDLYREMKTAHDAGYESHEPVPPWGLKGPIEPELADRTAWRSRFIGPDGQPVDCH